MRKVATVSVKQMYEAIKQDPRVIHNPEFADALGLLCEEIAYNWSILKSQVHPGDRRPIELEGIEGIVPGRKYPMVPRGGFAAEAALARILTVYVEGMLPGWVVTIQPRRRRGRPPESALLKAYVVAEHDALRCQLAELELATEPDESDAAFVDRVVPIVQRIVERIGRSFLAPRHPGGRIWLFCPGWWPLSDDQLRRLVGRSVSRLQISKARLTLEVLSYYHELPIKSIRNILGRNRRTR